MKKVSILIFTFCLILSSCATSKRAQQEVSITATQWKLITVATSSKELKPSEENPVTLKIENNQASGNSGCNYFSGPVELKEKSLKFGDLASTRKYCMESMEIENVIGDSSPEVFEKTQGDALMANNIGSDIRNYYVL